MLGLRFETRPAGIDETPRPGEPAHDLAIRLAREKAAAAAVSPGPAPATTSVAWGSPATASSSKSTPLWAASRPAYPITRPCGPFRFSGAPSIRT